MRSMFLSAVTLAAYFTGLAFGAAACAGEPVSASVRVDCPAGNVTASGSGTIVAVEDGRALVLTNRHVCPHDGEIYCVFADGTRGRGLYLGADDTADIAAVCILDPAKLPTPQTVEPCPPAKAAAAQGVTVVQVGYPHACRQPVRRAGQALLRGVHQLLTGASVHTFALNTESGDSGSGVFANGELVAMVWGGNGVEASCVDLADVHRFCSVGRVAYYFPQLAVKCKGCSCGPTCPAGGCCTNGQCGQAGCVADGWHPVSDNSGDFGWYDGGVCKGRWFVKTHLYHTHDGKAYAEKGTPIAVKATPPPPVFLPSFGGFGGGCVGGRCGR